MILNSIEYWAMNNPIRGLIQKRLEAPRLKYLCNGRADTILEIGCGQGAGAKIICDLFGPQEYVGIDLDPKMVERAKRKEQGLKNARFLQGDAAQLPFIDSTFDLVVDFGIIHHIPNWREALAELHRILMIDGELFFEELPVETWERGIGKPLKRLLEHPYEEMFRQHEFVSALEGLGFEVEMYEDSLVSFYHFWGRATKTG
jgi:ubiquinone/menaquinone biosynthesis C-methylase UbiE